MWGGEGGPGEIKNRGRQGVQSMVIRVALGKGTGEVRRSAEVAKVEPPAVFF